LKATDVPKYIIAFLLLIILFRVLAITNSPGWLGPLIIAFVLLLLLRQKISAGYVVLFGILAVILYLSSFTLLGALFWAAIGSIILLIIARILGKSQRWAKETPASKTQWIFLGLLLLAIVIGLAFSNRIIYALFGI